MRMITILSIIGLMCFCGIAKAQWTNFPASGNTNGYEWEQIRTNWIQLLKATDERSKSAYNGFEYNYSNGFSVVDNYRVPAGVTNIVGAYVAVGFPIQNINYSYALNTNTAISSGIGVSYFSGFDYWISTNKQANHGEISTLHKFLSLYSLDKIYTNSTGLVSDQWYYEGTTNLVPGAYTYFTNSFTNSYQIYTNIAMTNLNLTPYTYTDETGTYTATGYPHVTQSEQATLDARIMNLIPYFVMTNQAIGGTFDDWFLSGTNAFPMCTATDLFTSLHIGYVTNGQAYFTRYPQMTNQWTLFEAAYNGTWQQNVIGTNALRYYETALPVAKYTSGGTNAITSYSFVITGKVLTVSDQSISNASETVVVIASNTPLTKMWQSITSITCTNPGANIGDNLAISYTNQHPVYGDAPFEIYSADLDERWKVLNALRWTSILYSQDLGDGGTNGSIKEAPRGTNIWSTWSDAQAAALGISATNYGWKAFPFDNYNIGAGRVTFGESYSTTNYQAGISSGSNSFSIPIHSEIAPSIYEYTTTTNATYGDSGVDFTNQFDLFNMNGLMGSNTFFCNTNAWLPATNTVATNSFGYGGYDTNYNWCVQPTFPTAGVYNSSVRGFRVKGLIFLLKWDENGNSFKMK